MPKFKENAEQFDVDDGKYSQSKFYTKSTDGHGHKDTTRVNFSPDLMHLMSKYVHEFVQYDTIGDLIRDAVAHRVHQLKDVAKSPEVIRETEELEAMATMRDMSRRIERQMKEVEEVHDKLLLAQHRGNKENMQSALATARLAEKTLDAPFCDRLRLVIGQFEQWA